MYTHHIDRRSISLGLKQLSALRLIEIESGPRRGNVFRLSRRWCAMSEAEAAQRSEEASEIMPRRRYERHDPVQPPQEPEPVETDVQFEPPPERRKPSMPAVAWIAGGR